MALAGLQGTEAAVEWALAHPLLAELQIEKMVEAGASGPFWCEMRRDGAWCVVERRQLNHQPHPAAFTPHDPKEAVS